MSQHKVHTQSSTNEKMPCKYEQQKAHHQKLFGLLSKQNKFKELIEKYNETGMIAIIKGIEPGPNEEVYRIILVASATAEVSNGQKINQEMIRLNLADPNRKDDSGYNSSPLNPRSKLEAETLAKAVQGLLIII